MNWDLYSCCRFRLICQGGNSIDIQCQGQALQQSVRMSCSLVNFGEVKLGASTNRMISLYNDSETHSVYEIVNDASNVFAVVENIGVVKPRSYNRIYVTFTP